MEKRLFYPAVHVTEVMERLRRDVFNSDCYRFSLGILESETSEPCAERMLSGAVDAIAHRREYEHDQARFEWDATGKYAPGVRFAIPSYDGPGIDENGYLVTPIRYDRADLVLPFLKFNFRGNTADALVAWGLYKRMDLDGNELKDMVTEEQVAFWCTGGEQAEIIHSFCQSATYEATHTLVAVPWGGAHSETRGQSVKILVADGSYERGLEFFQQCSSSRGGEGYDYYIIDIAKAVSEKMMESFREALARSFDRVEAKRRHNRYVFNRKYCAFQARKKEYEELQKKVAEIETPLNVRYSNDIKKSEIAQRPCVILPEKVGSVYDYLEIPEQPTDYTWSLDAMNQARITKETLDKLVVAQAALNAKMDAWLDFAPLYADLAEVIIQKCHGMAEVHLDCLEMAMPNTYLEYGNMPGTGVHNKRKYDFSEAHLEACVEYVKDFLDDSQAKRKENLLAINKLAGKDQETPETPEK